MYRRTHLQHTKATLSRPPLLYARPLSTPAPSLRSPPPDLQNDFINSSVAGTLPSPDAQAQFGNPGHLIDGNAYGIAIHGRGVLVNGFGLTLPFTLADTAQDVTLENTRITGVAARVTEVVTISSKETQTPIVDVAGSVFRVDEQVAPNGMLHLDALHTARIEYAR